MLLNTNTETKGGRGESPEPVIGPHASMRGGLLLFLWFDQESNLVAICGDEHGRGRLNPGELEQLAAVSARDRQRHGIWSAVAISQDDGVRSQM